jgi:hypothetical protein
LYKEKKMLPACPHCGDEEHDVYCNVRAYGWCTEWFDENGKQIEMSTDNLHFTNPKTVRCGSCKKIRSDLVSSATKITVKEIT